MIEKRILVVGAGFSGSTIARILAEEGFFVDVIDKRKHVAGNAYDYENKYGIRVHKYGPHIFHTSNGTVVEFLSRFTNWLPYKHRVKGMLEDGQLVTLPPNLETANIVGEENLVDIFYRPYSKKMWGVDLEDLDSSVLSRVKIRQDTNDLYFPNDSFQAMPEKGYTHLISVMLNHPNINVFLETGFTREAEVDYSHTFNSMAIDEYFDYVYGDLPYRSIKFSTATLPAPKIFPVSVVNFTHAGVFTRITEWKNFPGHGTNDVATTLTWEQPCSYQENNFERYYPIRDPSQVNKAQYERYLALVPPNIKFVGRCGLYAYLDMDQAVSSAMAITKKFLSHTHGKS